MKNYFSFVILYRESDEKEFALVGANNPGHARAFFEGKHPKATLDSLCEIPGKHSVQGILFDSAEHDRFSYCAEEGIDSGRGHSRMEERYSVSSMEASINC